MSLSPVLHPARLALVMAMLAALLPAGPLAAADPEPPGDCPSTMPIGDVGEGQTGIGWTVVRGTEPRPFAVEVLGVFPGGVLPGHDLILVRVSDLGDAHFIENAGGIWAGMSGSPVYIDDRLVGAVAYGFSVGASTLGGLTPVGEMLEVSDLEPAGGATALSRRLRRAVAAAGPSTAEASTFGRLALPVTLPRKPGPAPRDASPRRRAEMRARFNVGARLADRGLKALRVSGVPSAPSRLATGRPVAGGNFAASLSFGDLKVVAMGTTTWVCGDRVLAFGHPFLQTGRANLGAHLAHSFDIVDDPTVTPYKLAAPGELVGRVGQDRTAAIAARLDRMPDLLAITSVTRHQALGRQRDGASWVAPLIPRFLRWELPSWHAADQVLSVADGYEDGSVGMELHVSGRRADGTPFEVTFGDRWIGADDRNELFTDTVWATLYGVGLMLFAVVENPYERVEVQAVDLDLDLRSAARWVLTGLSVSRNGGRAQPGPVVCVLPGDRLSVRAQLSSLPGGTVVQRQLRVVVPRRFASLRVGGGAGISPWDDGGGYGSFDGLLAGLAGTPRSDELVARVVASGVTRAATRSRLKRVVLGGASIPLRRIGSPACS